MMDVYHGFSQHLSWRSSCCKHMGWVSRPETLLLQPWESNLMIRRRYWGRGWKSLEEVQVSHIQPHTGSVFGRVWQLWTSPERIQTCTRACQGTLWTLACPFPMELFCPAHTGNLPEGEGNSQKLLPEQQIGLMMHKSRLFDAPKLSLTTPTPPPSISFLFCHHLPSISHSLGSIFLVGCSSLLSLSRIKLFIFLHGPLGRLWSCLCHRQCYPIPETWMPGKKKKKKKRHHLGE